jgi:aspartate/methionine/tyrosine aminotransferase
MLLVRGFGKTYGCTGWRLGFAAGPRALIQQMAKLQQYTFVCAPSMAQVGAAVSYDVDMSGHVQRYEARRDLVIAAFEGVAEVTMPGGAFYAFVRVPEQLGLTASAFVERAIERNVLVIPGSVFSDRDTHFRLSYAAPEEKLRAGLEILVDLAGGG